MPLVQPKAQKLLTQHKTSSRLQSQTTNQPPWTQPDLAIHNFYNNLRNWNSQKTRPSYAITSWQLWNTGNIFHPLVSKRIRKHKIALFSPAKFFLHFPFFFFFSDFHDFLANMHALGSRKNESEEKKYEYHLQLVYINDCIYNIRQVKLFVKHTCQS
jgi:hypothetical protein